jgi:hypothetical protein
MFAVICRKSTGQETEFDAYPTRAEADLVAARLREFNAEVSVRERSIADQVLET